MDKQKTRFGRQQGIAEFLIGLARNRRFVVCQHVRRALALNMSILALAFLIPTEVIATPIDGQESSVPNDLGQSDFSFFGFLDVVVGVIVGAWAVKSVINALTGC